MRTAFDGGINHFFFYGAGNKPFIDALAPLVRAHRPNMILGTGSEVRERTLSMAVGRKLVAALGTEPVDIFFAEYVLPSDQDTVIRQDGGLNVLIYRRWG